MATHAINEFNSKSLREKTAMITDVTLNVASFVGVPETAITKVAQIQKLDKLHDAVNLVNKMDDLYDAGMSMKRIDRFSDTLSVFKKSEEQQIINITEAALINYFKPPYNVNFVENFPNVRHKGY